MANEPNTPEDTNAGILAAIDEALGGNSEQDTGTGATGAEGDTHLDEEGVDTGADDGAGEADTGDESGGDEAGGDKPAGEGAKAPEGADKSGEQPPSYPELVKDAAKLGIQQRHANGHIKSGAELAAEIAQKQAEGGDGKGGAAAAKKAPDALNDPIPKDLKPETNQRMRTLIGMAKEANEKVAQAEGNFNQFITGLQSAGVTPEQYGETVSFLALFNSNDVKQQDQALTILEDMTDKLCAFLGKERRSSDPLERHPDLQAAIQKREITPQLARQMAVQRNQTTFRQEVNTAAQNGQQAAAAAERERQTAVSDLNALELELQANDPLYARKKAAILPSLKAALVDIPPSRWKAAFQRAYASAKVAPIVKKPVVPTNQPMRAGKAPAGAGASSKTGGSGLNDGGPKTMFEAMWGTAPPK